MIILAIETSCDETAISIVEGDGDLTHPHFTVLSQVVSSQVKLHAKYGGVVPMLAKREHERNLVLVLKEALKEANLYQETKTDYPEETLKSLEKILVREEELQALFIPFIKSLAAPNIDAIAVTEGPGLEPALWVGINFARALSLAWGKPLIPVNHLEGHIYSSLIQGFLQFPAVALLISGGHTELVLVKDWLSYQVVGQTRDDAVGEAFDKVARMLDLPYPGGPQISRLASEVRAKNLEAKFVLPRPMLNSPDLDFSFSGLKTAVLYLIKKLGLLSDEQKQEIAREFEDAVIEVLVKKTLKAIDEYGAQTLIIGGGVVANTALRQAFSAALAKQDPTVNLLIPPPDLATDNATMIAMAAHIRAQRDKFTVAPAITAKGNLVLQ